MLISTHCSGLQSLDLQGCRQITVATIISISENCTGLKELYVYATKITDTSLIAIVKNSNGLQLLDSSARIEVSNYKLSEYFKSVSERRAVLLSIPSSLPI